MCPYALKSHTGTLRSPWRFSKSLRRKVRSTFYWMKKIPQIFQTTEHDLHTHTYTELSRTFVQPWITLLNWWKHSKILLILISKPCKWISEYLGTPPKSKRRQKVEYFHFFEYWAEEWTHRKSLIYLNNQGPVILLETSSVNSFFYYSNI